MNQTKEDKVQLSLTGRTIKQEQNWFNNNWGRK